MKGFYLYVLNAQGTQDLKVPVPLDEGRAGTNLLSFMSWVANGGKVVATAIDIPYVYNTEADMNTDSGNIPLDSFAYVIVGGVIYKKTAGGLIVATTPDTSGGGGGGGGGGDVNYNRAYGKVSGGFYQDWKIWAGNGAVAQVDTGTPAVWKSGMIFAGEFRATKIEVVSATPSNAGYDGMKLILKRAGVQVRSIFVGVTEVDGGENTLNIGESATSVNGVYNFFPSATENNVIDEVEISTTQGILDVESEGDFPVKSVKVYSQTTDSTGGEFPSVPDTTLNQIYRYKLTEGTYYNPTYNTPDTIYVNTPGMVFPSGHFPIAGNHGAKLSPSYTRNGDPAPLAAYTVTMQDLQDLVTGTYSAQNPQLGGFTAGDVLIKSGEYRRVVNNGDDMYYIGLHWTYENNSSFIHPDGFTIEFTGRFSGMEVADTAIDFYKSGNRMFSLGAGITEVQKGREQLA